MRSKAGILIAGLVLACGSSKPKPEAHATICVDGDARCGDACSAKQPCPQGLFCTGGLCAKDGKTTDGRSVTDGSMSGGGSDGNGSVGKDGGVIAKSDAGKANGGGGKGSGNGNGGSDDGDEEVCSPTSVHTTRVEPTVILIVDQSISMNQDFGGDTRWNVLRDFLLSEPDGLIADLQDQVRFGLALYSAVSTDGSDGPVTPVGECPQVTTVAPGFDNFDAIAAVYSESEPIDDGPTGDSIDNLVAQFGLDTPDSDVGTNTVFVLATDGEPDSCEQLDPPSDAAKQESIDAITRAFALGVRTYVISVGDEIGAGHQQQLANAGLGLMPGQPDAEYWSAGDDASLRKALELIVSSQLGCEFALNARVKDGTECDGTVTLNNADLECNGKEGWKLIDPTHIQLVGDACAELKAKKNVVLDATFPCTFKD